MTILLPGSRAARGNPLPPASESRLAFVTVPGRGRIDDCLVAVAGLLQAEGVRLAGTVRAGPVEDAAHRCDMDLRVLPRGQVHRISQDLGRHARGCRLDGGVIEAIAAEVEAGLAGADLLVINKFGKLESQGRALAPAIGRALDLGMPVLVGVNAMNLSGFLLFAEGLAVALSAEPPVVLRWARSLRLAASTV